MGEKIPVDFFSHNDVLKISKNLIGKNIITNINNNITSGMIVETEAYAGIYDKASHAYKNKRTNRTEIMYWSKHDVSNLPKVFKTSLRIDELIFNYDKCLKFIEKYNYPSTDEGLKQYIKYWYIKLQPEYFMASLPSNFTYILEE